MVLVASCGVELCQRDPGSEVVSIEARPPYLRAGEIGVGQRGTSEVCVGKVLADEVAAGKIVVTRI